MGTPWVALPGNLFKNINQKNKTENMPSVYTYIINYFFNQVKIKRCKGKIKII